MQNRKWIFFSSLCFLATCADRPGNAPDLYSSSVQHCLSLYPEQVGSMENQADCISSALRTYGPDVYGHYYDAALFIDSVRKDVWAETDEGSVPITMAMAELQTRLDTIQTTGTSEQKRLLAAARASLHGDYSGRGPRSSVYSTYSTIRQDGPAR